MSENYRRFVFQDYSGKRWNRLMIILLSVFIFLSILLSIIGFSLFQNPVLPQVTFGEKEVIQAINEPLNKPGKPARLGVSLQKPFKIQKGELYGFYLANDVISKKTVTKNIKALGVLVPNWYWLDSNHQLQTNKEKDIIKLAEKNGVRIMPRFSLQKGTSEAGFQKLLKSAESRHALITSLHKAVKKDQFAGINIDIKQVRTENREHFTAFVSEIYKLFHADGLKVTVTVSPDHQAYDYKKIAAVSDRVIVKFFKELPEMERPGPVASIDWFQETLKELPIPPEKMIISLSNEGYEWDMDKQEMVNCLMFHEVMKAASLSSLTVQWDPQSNNPYIRFTKNGVPHLIWFLDAATSYNQIRLGLAHGVKGVGIEQLGYEDPGLWKYLSDTSRMEANTKKLKKMENPIPIISIGGGEIIRLSSKSQEGSRTIQLDSNGFITSESYTAYPLPYYIERYGEQQGKVIVLSFDDGPDPAYTPKILDILSKESVRASFYVVGRQAALYPDILERIHREGHELGNHTFSHTDIQKDGPYMLQAEINSTQRLIQQITGYSAILYRPPYTPDLLVETAKELTPFLQAQELGYTMVGSYIDTKDWDTGSSNQIVNRMLNNLEAGSVVLLHDAGGDRSATVEALPKMIKVLKNEGYTFATVSDLIGMQKLDIMPPAEEEAFPFLLFYKIADILFIWTIQFCSALFMLGIALGIIRLIILFFFSLKHGSRKPLPKPPPSYEPFVSIIIPAYNEEKVIIPTLKSILKNQYKNYEVIIVNDGSTDNTYKAVKKITKSNRIVRQFIKENQGKTAALNSGILVSRGDIIITMDADTSIAPEAISHLVKHFQDENVAAVAGNVRIGNSQNMLTLWQHIEYVTGFNLEKRAFHELNCVTVVPGAIGALRKNAIMEAGLYEDDTLAEDTDITLRLIRIGYRIHYEPNAYAYTEAPEILKSLIKQRFRWSYGILQCLWKHSGAIFSRKHKGLGFVGLPYMWFQYVFQAFSPLIDIVFLIGLFGDTRKIITYYLLFFLVDLLVSVYAFRLERISFRPLIHLVVQRFIYRQLLVFAIWKAFIFAAKGIMIGWNKLQRTGNVRLPG
ncbi:glycosyltransferase [Bacillus sp. EB01]|uniref:glycosyltransferase n=1 Tax=Bacillus sp. EB01 TaxID=1347086 RepID=UPI0005C66DA7|nr:glycosyltransferase [Bacillus sp. EB01]